MDAAAVEMVERHLHAARRQLEVLEERIRTMDQQRLCTAGAVQTLEKVLGELKMPRAQAPAGQEDGHP
jgi:hypothetical protein